ncbi:MAG TPA: hypothetical protein DEG43_11020 [Acidimicrobiaceae bacterium]|nr:hypothetical protein [Acidimicrobiaceae bacterium]
MHDTATDWEHMSLVPPRRLGSLLSSARASKGLTIEDLAHSAGGKFSLSTLSSIERGTHDVTEIELGVLADIYELEATIAVPSRSKLVVDLEEGLLRVEGNESRIPRHQANRQDVLSRYLAMVYTMRHVEAGREITLRVDDLEVLGSALRVGSQTLESDLVSLMRNPNDVVGWRTRILRTKMTIPAAGLLVAFCGVGALLLVPSGSDTPTQSTVVPIAATVETQIGDAVVLERAADGSPGAITVRTGVGSAAATSVERTLPAAGSPSSTTLAEEPVVQER